jgi:hypothetical protein
MRPRRDPVLLVVATIYLVAATLWVNGAEVLRKMFFEELIQRAMHDDVAQAAGLSFGRDVVRVAPK